MKKIGSLDQEKLRNMLSIMETETLIELKNAGYTIVMVEQKASRALEVSDWGYVMHLGRVAFSGAAAALRVDDKVKRAYLGELPPELESRFTQTEDA